MTKAFITGSHAYGTPGPRSDVDVVVLIDDAALDALRKIATDDDGSAAPDDCGASLRFGKLNLILVTKPAVFDAWRVGTEELIARRPVTRDDACRSIAGLLAVTPS